MKAAQAYPDPVFAPIPPENSPGDQREMDRVAAAEAANQLILNNAINERNRRIKEFFTNAMPIFIKRKLVDQMKQQQYETFVQWLGDKCYSSNYAQVTVGREMHSTR